MFIVYAVNNCSGNHAVSINKFSGQKSLLCVNERSRSTYRNRVL